VALQRKDLRLALETGSATGTPLPVTALVQELYGILAATGRSGLDNSSLAVLMQEFAGCRESGSTKPPS
jgi:2-hydroxy-3-oxopropionate reductase